MHDDSQRSLPERASGPLVDSEPFDSFDSDGEIESLIQRVAYAPAVAPQALLAWKSPASLIGVTVAHFRVERLLGVGGLGIVYAARDLTLDRVVALKVLTPPTDGDVTSRDRVLHEARAAVRVNDPSVAAIYEVGEDDGLAFIAMEYVEGETLQARLDRGPLAWPIAVGLASQLARGLAKAHAQGVVHRDLKPENLILGPDGKLKILDFGVAAERGSKTPEAGTPVYMAPEQARAEVADPRVDIYAFGVVLLECLTGSVPLLPPPLFFAAARVQMEARGCPAKLRSVIERCIEEDPAARFDDGASLARAVARVARRDADRQRRWKLAATVVLALAAGICGLWIGARKRHTSVDADRVAAEEHGRLRRLTANVAERPILGSALSPDGMRLAYSDSAGLRVTRIGTSEETPVRFASKESPQIVRWFGDGARLAVVVAAPGRDDRDLRIVDVATGSSSSLGRGNFTALALSPDGRRVAYAEDDAVGWLAIDKPAERHFLVRKDAGCFIGDIAWSPKGGRLAYASLCFDSLAATTLETIGLDGGPARVVMNEPRLFNDMARGGVAWLPRGDLLFSLAEWLPSEPGSNLWVLALDEASGTPKGDRRQVTHWTGVAVSSLSIDAAGDRASFVRYDVQTDVFLGELTANKELARPPSRLTLKERNERSPTWDKEGRGVYYSSDESGNFDIFYQDLREGHSPAPAVASHAWETEPVLSPDGKQLLYWQIFPVEPGGATSAELMTRALGVEDAMPTFLTRIVSHPAGMGRPPPWEARVRCASAPGAACVLTKNEGDDLVFYRLDPARADSARTLEELLRYPHPPAATRFWDVSPDGTLLAIPIANGPVRIEPLVAGERRRELVVPAGCDPGVLSWSKDQRGIFVSSECAEEPVFRLYYLPLSSCPSRERGRAPVRTCTGASPASLVWQDPPNYLLEPEPSPDGRHLAIVVKRPDDDVWLADGL